MHHSGWTSRVCWWKERQDRKGLIIVVLAPAEGKTRLERFNYSCTAPEGPTPHKKQHTFWSIIVCTCAAGRKYKTGKVQL